MSTSLSISRTDEQDQVPLLAAEAMTVSFGGVHAVRDVDFQVWPREILGLIGPNGAGKTTLINALTGVLPQNSSGKVQLTGHDISSLTSSQRALRGLVRTFQGARVFETFTAAENVEAALLAQRESLKTARRVARGLLSFVGLSEPDIIAGALPYGDQRRLAIARALAMAPKVLLLDEPAAGLTDTESEELGAMIHSIRDNYDCGVVLVEHDMKLVMSTCTSIQVLVEGETLTRGDVEAVRRDPEVVAAYLGGEV